MDGFVVHAVGDRRIETGRFGGVDLGRQAVGRLESWNTKTSKRSVPEMRRSLASDSLGNDSPIECSCREPF